MNPNRIEKGDRVAVFFNRCDMLQGIVEYIPVATGDSWIIKTHDDSIFYFQNHEQMQLCEKADNLEKE